MYVQKCNVLRNKSGLCARCLLLTNRSTRRVGVKLGDLTRHHQPPHFTSACADLVELRVTQVTAHWVIVRVAVTACSHEWKSFRCKI